MPPEDGPLGLSTSETGSQSSVLLLDDDERDLTLLEEILRPDGFRVLKTTDPTTPAPAAWICAMLIGVPAGNPVRLTTNVACPFFGFALMFWPSNTRRVPSGNQLGFPGKPMPLVTRVTLPPLVAFMR